MTPASFADPKISVAPARNPQMEVVNLSVQGMPTVDDMDPDVVEPASDTEGDASPGDEDVDAAVEVAPDGAGGDSEPVGATRGRDWRRTLTWGLLPGLVMLLALVTGALKFWDSSARESQSAGIESVQAARDSTVAMLSYQPDTVEEDLTAAQDLLTGAFRDSYMELTHDVVIPGSKHQHISTVANVPAAASVSATPDRAVVVVFVNQAATVGSDAPTNTASSVRVTLEKVSGRWLISAFDPI